MVPYTFDAGTPRERIDEDMAMRLRRDGPNDGYFAQLQGDSRVERVRSRASDTIDVPTLVIHGETDELVPAENGRIIARAIPNARLVMLPNASHIFYTDQPAAAQEAILSFLLNSEI